MDKKSLIYIVNPAIAKELLLKGFSILDIAPNPMNTEKTIFYFKDSTTLKEILKDEYNYYI